MVRRRRVSSAERSALLTGAFVLLGAIIAAGSGTIGVFLQQQHDDHRLSADETLQAQGAARILGADLGHSVAELRTVRAGGRLHRLSSPLMVNLSDDNFVLVAGKMSDSGWGSIAVALSVLTEIEAYIEGQAGLGSRQLTREEACSLSVDVGIVVYGMYRLSAVTDQPLRSPVKVPRCGPALPSPLRASR
jgi:hypothetical protein